MIISHSKEFVFCRIPKNASTAVAHGFINSFVNGDQLIAQNHPYEQKQAKIDRVSPHIRFLRAAEYGLFKPHYRKVVVVRNPYDRFISACANVLRSINDNDLSSENLLRAYHFANDQVLFCSYKWFLEGVEDPLVIRYENLQNDFDRVSDELGLERYTLKRVYAGLIPQSKYRELYTPNLRAIAEQIHSDDFYRFGYEW